MATSDLMAQYNERKVFHIPALFGDDFAYTNSSHNFLFINQLIKVLERYA
jgi:hypothetical protein